MFAVNRIFNSFNNFNSNPFQPQTFSPQIENTTNNICYEFSEFKSRQNSKKIGSKSSSKDNKKDDDNNGSGGSLLEPIIEDLKDYIARRREAPTPQPIAYPYA